MIRMAVAVLVLSLAPPAKSLPLCANLTDTYALALADLQGRGDAKWQALLTDGNCADVRGALYVLTIDSYSAEKQTTRIAQFMIDGRRLYGLSVGELPPHVFNVRDDGQWAQQPESVRKWFRELMQPDYPNTSCCGEADAFEADDFEQDGDRYVAIITDGRGIIPNGTRVIVPNYKIKWDKGNPTGHGIIFIGNNGVLCYVPPSGV